MLERLFDPFGVGLCGGVCTVTNILPRWGKASISKNFGFAKQDLGKITTLTKHIGFLCNS